MQQPHPSPDLGQTIEQMAVFSALDDEEAGR
jgi:hypothetical protein